MRVLDTEMRASSKAGEDSYAELVSTTMSIGTEDIKEVILAVSLRSPMIGEISFMVRVFAFSAVRARP